MVSWFDKEAVGLVKVRLHVHRSHLLRVRLYAQDLGLTTLSTSSRTLMSDGEALILQWVVKKGHLMESGGLNTPFLSGYADPCHRASDALFVGPLEDLKCWRRLYCL